MDRAEFLARLRAARPAAAASSPHSTETGGPASSGNFGEELASVGGYLHRARSVDAAGTIVAKLLSEHGVERVACGTSNSIAALDLEKKLAARTIEIVLASREDKFQSLLFDCEAGVTEAAFGIAETGSIVELSTPRQPRCLSLVPPFHIAVLRANDILPNLTAFIDRLEAPLPSAITLITGPSRTGDIELVLTIGVHGPESLHVVLVDD